MNAASENGEQAKRKAAMSVLAKSDLVAIAELLEALALPDHKNLREPENGLVMLRGRIGGDGAPFNLGEATVSRAAIQLSSGEIGFGYALGRDREKARLIALCDALIQSGEYADGVEVHMLTPLRERLNAIRNRRAAETAATKVDFYTLVRGEG